MKRRKGKQRRSKDRILILCEGKTEKQYFQAIKEDADYKKQLSAINPQVVEAKNPTPERVVQEAIKRFNKAQSEGNPYQKVWIVIDHDNHANRRTAYDQAIGKGFNVSFSAICFEKWFLLHFERSARTFTSVSQLERVLKRHYPNYEKAKQNDFASLKDKLEAAFQNAEWLRNQIETENTHVTNLNPWTDVDVLVGQLIKK